MRNITSINQHNIMLRPIKLDDFETVLMWSGDDVFCKANNWSGDRSIEQLKQWWKSCVTNNSNQFIRLGIILDKSLIGYADLTLINKHTAEVGIAIGQTSLWGKGIGYTALNLLIDYGARELNISTYYAETHEANIRSINMLENLGFKQISQLGVEEYAGTISKLIQYQYSL